MSEKLNPMTEAGRSLWLIAPTGESSAEEDQRSREYIEGEVAHKAINVYLVGTFSSVVYGIIQTIRVCGERVRHFKRQWGTVNVNARIATYLHGRTADSSSSISHHHRHPASHKPWVSIVSTITDLHY